MAKHEQLTTLPLDHATKICVISSGLVNDKDSRFHLLFPYESHLNDKFIDRLIDWLAAHFTD